MTDASYISLKTLYRCMQRFENKIGGGEGCEGVYGSITLQGMDAVMKAMVEHCELKGESGLVDVGVGLGRPLMHAMLSPGVQNLWGIEIDGIKVQKANAFTKLVREQLINDALIEPTLHTPPKITHSAIEDIDVLAGYTHVYSFWEGVPIEGKRALGKLFTAADTMRGLAVVQRAFRKPADKEMAKLGFHSIELVQTIKVRMSGSGQSFHAYIFKRRQAPTHRATFAIYQTPSKIRPNRHSYDKATPNGAMSTVRRSLLFLELHDRTPCRSKSDHGVLHEDETLLTPKNQ